MNAPSPIAQRFDLFVNQGATFRQQLTVNGPSESPIDFTGCTAILQIREMRSLLEILAIDTSTAALELGGTSGTILISLTPTQTATFPISSSTSVAQAATFVYDVLITFPSGDVFRYVFGVVNVAPSISIPA